MLTRKKPPQATMAYQAPGAGQMGQPVAPVAQQPQYGTPAPAPAPVEQAPATFPPPVGGQGGF